MNDKDSDKTGPIYAVIIDLYSTSLYEVLVYETIKKLYKMANSNLPSDGQLILPKIMFATNHAYQEVCQSYWDAKGIEHMIEQPIEESGWKLIQHILLASP